ncbi:MAG: hypothetical protein K4305_04015, partial [Chlorobium sp.]|uniref:hypothetical protein n=1 Tax=Chlorobium sp. TaxID=1095 RepID=UPI002F3FC514
VKPWRADGTASRGRVGRRREFLYTQEACLSTGFRVLWPFLIFTGFPLPSLPPVSCLIAADQLR